MIDLTVMGDRKPSMALLDHLGAGVFRAPSGRSLGSHLSPGAEGIAWSPGPLLPAPAEVAPPPCGTRTLGPGPSADGAACPHASPQEMHGPKGIPHGEADYTDAVRLLKPNEDVFWALMRNCEGLRAGARGDLQGSFQILHFDSENSPVFVDEVLKRIKRLDSNGEERKFKRVERLSDNQELCLASLRPQLFVPTNVEKQTFKLVRPQGRVCCEKRNEGIHRRVLGNYYYTGFCANHVSGEGPE